MIRLTAVIEVPGQAPRALTHESNALTIILGRDATANFQLPLATISRHHARISETDGLYVIEDLGSTHGTKLNDKELGRGEKKVLRSGDVIEMTKAKITCAIESEKVASQDPTEGTGAVAARAVQGILGRLGDAKEGNPYLRAITGSVTGTRYPLLGGVSQWTLGRSQDCECVIDDVNVSRRHAIVRKDWSGYVLEDLGSKNGILLNDKPVTRRARLKHEDELQIGPIKLVFIDPDADLLDALKAVPGFEVEESIPDADPPEDPAAPQNEMDGPAPADTPAPPEEAPDELADLDPSLLEPPPMRHKHADWAVVGAAVAVAVGAGIGLYFILA